MKKSLLALAVLGAFAGVASAQSSVTIYGRVDQEFAKPAASKDKQIADNASRLGFKGTEDLGNGLSAVFRFEHGFSADTGAASDPFWNRYAMVGLSSSKYGTLTLGRLENGAWDVESSFDPFGGEAYANLRDVGSTLQITSWDVSKAKTLDARRVNNAVRYDIAYQGFKGSASIGEATAQDKPWAVGGSYTAGPLYVGAGYEKLSADKAKMWIVGATYDFGIAKAYANYAAGTTDKDQDVKGFLVGATAPYGAFVFKAGYAQSKVELSANNDQMVKKGSLGADYNLSKRTKLYADYIRAAGDMDKTQDASKNKNGYELGLRHTF